MGDVDGGPDESGRYPRVRSDVVERQARAAGLRGDGLSLEAVEQRRFQIWIVMSVLLVTVSLIVALTSVWTDLSSFTVVRPDVLRFGMVGLSLAFSGYVFEKERHLRRLTHQLVEERVLKARLSMQTQQLQALLDAGRAVTASLEIERVVDLVLRSALDLLDAEAGSIMLVEGGELVVRASRGGDLGVDTRARLGEGVVGRVAQSRSPMLVTGRPLGPGTEATVDNGMCVPLVHDDRLLGVLNVTAREADFGHLDLSVLETFAVYAASAVANARRFEQERANAERLRELESVQTEFRWLGG